MRSPIRLPATALALLGLALFMSSCRQNADGGGGGNGDSTAQPSDGGDGSVPPGDDTGDETPTVDEVNPLADFVPDPEVFAKAPDESVIVEGTAADGLPMRFAVNQMIVVLVEGAPRSAAEQLAENLGATIVGQIPSIGLYQFELATDTVAELDAALDQAAADPNVEAVDYNAANRFAEGDAMCPAINDNEDELILTDRCAFTDTAYYQAITMWDAFLPYLIPRVVIVAIIDTGIQLDHHEFDTVRGNGSVVSVNGPGFPLADWDEATGHGTAVAGIIAADDDGSGMNGIALRFLGRDLVLAIGTAWSTADSIALAEQACAAGTDIVNLSFESPFPNGREGARAAWSRLMRQYSSTLFVVAAGSDGRQVTASNSSPAGLSAGNCMTVGGTALCDPGEISRNSNWGAGITIGAPSELVPTVALAETATGFRNANGTSFAAPQVTSLAAILKSLQPNLSPTRLRQYIYGMALPGTADVGGARLTFTTSMLQLLIDMNLGEPIESWIDPHGFGSLGSTAIVLSRICPPGISYFVEGYGEFEEREPHDVLPIGIIYSGSDPYAFTFGSTTPEARLGMDTAGENVFSLTDYEFSEESFPGSAQLTFIDEDSGDLGHAISGMLTIATCRIDERDPFTGEDPWIVTIEGTFAGVVEMEHYDGSEPTPHEFEGYFTLPMTVFATDDEVGEELIDYLENSCEGGTLR